MIQDGGRSTAELLRWSRLLFANLLLIALVLKCSCISSFVDVLDL